MYKRQKLGRQKNIPVDVRIIAATNQPLEEMIRSGRFREDLYYRLNVVSIHIPPLRERGNDILLLTDHYLSVYNRKYHKDLHISGEVYQRFLAYAWPGNVRQLQNVIESVVVLSHGPVILLEDLPEQIVAFEPLPQSSPAAPAQTAAAPPPETGTLAEEMARHERQVIAAALARFPGDRKRAMEALGFSRRTFYRKPSQHRL